jgi:hypothetical protein
MILWLRKCVPTTVELERTHENLVHVVFKRCLYRPSVDADTVVGIVSTEPRPLARNYSRFADKLIIQIKSIQSMITL